MATVWNLPVFEKPYHDIAENGKEVEGRSPDPTNPSKDYRLIVPGEDMLRFFPIDPDFNKLPLKAIAFRVSFNHFYHRPSEPELTVEEMLLCEGLDKALPGVKSLEDGIQVYMSLPGYRERIAEHGIYAIGLGQRLL